MHHLLSFFKHILQSRTLITTLIIHDFKRHYFGSYLGLFWAFFQPIVFIAVIWFVFEVGFRSGLDSSGAPFSLWLFCGMIPWFFFSNSISSGTDAIILNAYLVKKVSFRVSILPLVQVGSAFIVHAVLVLLMIFVFLLYGYFPTLYWLQLFYYIFCSILLILGLTWMTSALRVFMKDIGNLVAVVLQIGFWATPIFWNIETIPERYRIFIELNPMFYIVDGYRDALIDGVWFWEKGWITLYFWFFCLTSLAFGALVFRRLRPHFGDVL